MRAINYCRNYHSSLYILAYTPQRKTVPEHDIKFPPTRGLSTSNSLCLKESPSGPA